LFYYRVKEILPQSQSKLHPQNTVTDRDKLSLYINHSFTPFKTPPLFFAQFNYLYLLHINQPTSKRKKNVPTHIQSVAVIINEFVEQPI